MKQVPINNNILPPERTSVMAYNLNQFMGDQLSVQGTYGPDNLPWAHVLHGRLSVKVGTPTSAGALTVMQSDWVGSICPLMDVNCVTTTYTLRQLLGWHYRYGRAAQVDCTVDGAGKIITAVIADAGIGLEPNLHDIGLPVYDFAGSGSGALIKGDTTAMGQLTNVVIVNGGTNYGTPFVDPPEPLQDGALPQAQIIDYGAIDQIVGATDAGTGAGDAQPSFNAYSFKARSSTPGRNGRGSLHLIGVPEGNTTGNKLTAGTITAANAAVGVWMVTPFNIAGGSKWQPQVFSKEIFFTFPPRPTRTQYSTWDISSAAVNPNVGSMLRRKVKQTA